MNTISSIKKSSLSYNEDMIYRDQQTNPYDNPYNTTFNTEMDQMNTQCSPYDMELHSKKTLKLYRHPTLQIPNLVPILSN